MNTATVRAVSTAKKMSRPSEADNKVLAGLFPAYKGGGQNKKFDPTDETMVAEQPRKKKAAFKGKGKGRSKSVLVMIVEGNSTPRGNKKESLKDKGKAKVLDFFCYMKLMMN